MGANDAAILNNNGGASEERYLRRQAIQIAAQLPENEANSIAILEYARELVWGFMAGRTDPPPAHRNKIAVLPVPDSTKPTED
jgi:hypothetical protein